MRELRARFRTRIVMSAAVITGGESGPRLAVSRSTPSLTPLPNGRVGGFVPKSPSASPPPPADPARELVERRMVEREATIGSLTRWLLSVRRLQTSVGAKYGRDTTGVRPYHAVADAVRDSHRLQLAIYVAALRLHTCESRSRRHHRRDGR